MSIVRIGALPLLAAPGGSDRFPIWRPSDDTTYGVALSTIFPEAADTISLLWSPTSIYNIDDVVLSDDLFWISLINTNLNNPPEEGAIWHQVNKASSGLVYWQAGLYTDANATVLYDDGTMIGLYVLMAAAPFNSTNFLTELGLGRWEFVGAMGAAVPDASTTVKGIVQLDTDGNIQGNVNSGRVVTSGNLSAWWTYQKTQAQTFAAKVTLTTAPRFSSMTANKFMAVDVNKDLIDAPYVPLNQAGDTMTGLLTLSADPTTSLQAATKNYVDSNIAGLKFKVNVRAASVANVNIASAPSALDGVTLVNGDRVLLKDQTTATQNGSYTFNGAGVALTRTTDGDVGSELVSATFPVSEGAINDDSWWTVTNDSITIGVTNIVFSQTAGSGTYTNGQGLTLTGNVFSIANNAITNTLLRQSVGLSVIGRSANTTGDVADITAGVDGDILRRSGTSIAFGSIDLSLPAAVGSSILSVANGGTGSATQNYWGLSGSSTLGNAGNFNIIQPVATSGSPTGWTFTGGAHTTLTASTEVTDILFALNRTISFNTGTLTNQRAIQMIGPTITTPGVTMGVTNGSTLYVRQMTQGTNVNLGGKGVITGGSYAIEAHGGIRVIDGFTGGGYFYQGANNTTIIGGGPSTNERITFGSSNTITAGQTFQGNGGFSTPPTQTLISSLYSYRSTYSLSVSSGSLSPKLFAAVPSAGHSTSGSYSGSIAGYSYNDDATPNSVTVGLTQIPFEAKGRSVASTGASSYTGLSITPIINNTSSHSGGVFSGVDINPNLANVVGTSLYALRVFSGILLSGFGVSTPVSNVDIAGSFGANIRTITASTTALFSDYTLLCDATSGNIVVTLPAAAGAIRRVYKIIKIDASINTVSVANASGTTVISLQWYGRELHCNGSSYYISALIQP